MSHAEILTYFLKILYECNVCGVTAVNSFSRPVGIGVYGHISHEVSVYVLEVFSREEDEADIFDPYTAELNQNKPELGTGTGEKRQQPDEQYDARERTSDLNVSGNNFLVHVYS
jgi:hypothetical protein